LDLRLLVVEPNRLFARDRQHIRLLALLAPAQQQAAAIADKQHREQKRRAAYQECERARIAAAEALREILSPNCAPKSHQDRPEQRAGQRKDAAPRVAPIAYQAEYYQHQRG